MAVKAERNTVVERIIAAVAARINMMEFNLDTAESMTDRATTATSDQCLMPNFI